MAGFEGYTPKRVNIQRPDGIDVPVRALNLEDITILVRDHYPPLVSMFEKYVVHHEAVAIAGDLADQIDLGDTRELLADVLPQAPTLIADVIARAADQPEQAALVKTLPAGTQIDGVAKIIRLTLEAEGGAKKLMGSIGAIMGAMNAPPSPEA